MLTILKQTMIALCVKEGAGRSDIQEVSMQ